MSYYTQSLRSVPVSERHPVGIAVCTLEHPTLAIAVAAEGTTGAIFCDEITWGRTMIRDTAGRWIADYANPHKVTVSHPPVWPNYIDNPA